MDPQFKFSQPGEVRVRFAPAPSGKLHIGGARTALFNYLFAKKYNGVFVLRIEDTDVERSKPEFEKEIMESLKWLGIEWDEGPDVGGNYGPYRQSERREIYKKYIEKLLQENKAYYCFCTKEELEAQRQYQLSIGEPPRYTGKCRNLSEDTVKKYLEMGKPYVIRFKVEGKEIEFEDLIRGKIRFDARLIGDFVIAKNFQSPLYNFACVVDDFEMRITHVIRAEDHISNTPKQILLQKAFGFYHPQYAHLPLILAPDRSKLSKRHGATAVSDFRKMGYLPEALVNFMALLGWNPGGDREFFSMSSLIKEFSLEKVQKSGAVFNIKKLDFFNGFYIRQKSLDTLTNLCIPYLIEAGLIEPLKETTQKFLISETKEIIALETLQKIVSLYQQRLKKLSEIVSLTDFFFKKSLEYEKGLLKWKEMSEKEILQSLERSEAVISKIKKEEWNKENLEKILMEQASKFSAEIGKEPGDRGYLLWPLRVALTGKEASAGPFEIAEVLGKEKTVQRLKEAKEKLKNP